MIKLSITTEGGFFTIYGIWFFIHQNFLKKEEEEEREYVLNEHFNGTIECNGIDLRMHRMCGRFFNKDDRFNIVLEGEYSIDDIYSISALLGQIIDRSRAVKFFTNNNNKDIGEI